MRLWATVKAVMILSSDRGSRRAQEHAEEQQVILAGEDVRDAQPEEAPFAVRPPTSADRPAPRAPRLEGELLDSPGPSHLASV